MPGLFPEASALCLAPEPHARHGPAPLPDPPANQEAARDSEAFDRRIAAWCRVY